MLKDFSDITLITVDLDDTVWPCASVIRQAEITLHEWLQKRATNVAAVHDVHSLRDHRLDIMREQPEIAHDLTAVRLASLRRLMDEFGYTRNIAEEAMFVFLEARNRVTPFPDVPPVLEALFQGFFLVSVTNGNADVRRTAIGRYFHHSVGAAEVGAAKPAPALFYRALKLTGTKPSHAVHIGDDPQLDVSAARRVGMYTIWVNRTHATWPDGLPPPDLSVADFSELTDKF
jgi:HAD superfamily hydrolase (TIGR01509 family)